jgi:hypothetical protein
MISTLPGIQVVNRCAAYDGHNLCGQPAPYLVTGTSLCPDHAKSYAEFARKTLGLPKTSGYDHPPGRGTDPAAAGPAPPR